MNGREAGQSAVEHYCEATAKGDVGRALEVVTPDVEVVSPISGRMVFRGRDDVAALFELVYGSLRNLHWSPPVGDERTQVSLAAARIGPVRLGDAMIFELAEDGRIRRIRPHLRPWLGLTLFALRLLPGVARRPAMIRRALVAGAGPRS